MAPLTIAQHGTPAPHVDSVLISPVVRNAWLSCPPLVRQQADGRLLIATTNGTEPPAAWSIVQELVYLHAHGLVMIATDIYVFIVTAAEWAAQHDHPTAFADPAVRIEDEPPRLTPRELDIVRLLIQGLSNRAIADHLIVAESTVKSYTRAIFRKLQVSSRHDVGKVARSYGFVPGQEHAEYSVNASDRYA